MAVLEGRNPDCIPWAPRLELWYTAREAQGTMPERYRGLSVRDILRRLDCGYHGLGGSVLRAEIKGVDITSEQDGPDTITYYRTPVGTVRTRGTMTAALQHAGIHAMEVEHMIKGPDDYRVVEYIIEHTEVRPAFEQYLAYERDVGDEGLPVVGGLGYDPMHAILRDYVGYNLGYLHLVDYPKEVDRLFRVLYEHRMKVLKIILDSPGRLIAAGSHFTTTMTPPPVFRKYFLPYYQEVSDALHRKGKRLVCHADGDTKGLLELIVESGFDMVECFVTAPMVTVTLDEARRVFGNKVIIWGGVPSAIICEGFPEEEFEQYMMYLFRTIAPGNAFVLGVADNVMPEAIIERVERISEMVKALGEYPIDCAKVREWEAAHEEHGVGC